MDTTRATVLSGASDPSLEKSLCFKEWLLVRLLRGLKYGSVHVLFPSGASRILGDPTSAVVTMRIRQSVFFKKLFAGGSIGLGESYVDGDWETDDLTALLSVFSKNQKDIGRLQQGFSLLTQKLNHWYHKARKNTLSKSVENIQEHYDLSNAFYETFLDPTMTYSSALFESKEESLEVAQIRKIDRILDLAGAKAGDSVLEIGSGWGALARRAAERGCTVRTVTLSLEQFSYAQKVFDVAGVAEQISIEMLDYRKIEGQYDAVVSCEMIEAVGREYLESYFATIRNALKPGAKAVIQAITIPDERYESYSSRCDWIQKHIFPGGHLPSPGTIREEVSKVGQLSITTMNSFGHDYAETLKRWAESFNAAKETALELGFDANFMRKWNYYLSYCEAGFATGLIDVKHVVIERA